MPSVVSVILPTLNRPQGLTDALASIAAQQDLADGVEAVVVDNAPDGNAEAVARAVPVPDTMVVRYVHETQTGVASARNAGLKAATGDLIAFMDDDCVASADWLANRLDCLRTSGADVVFGPHRALLDGEPETDHDWFIASFSRSLPLATGASVAGLCDHLALPGSIYIKARCFADGVGFNTRLDQIGGEDVLNSKRLRDAGRRMIWCNGAEIIEHVPASRLTHAYVWRRRYVSGQIRCLVPSLLDPPVRSEIAVQMAKGLAQVALAGPLCLAGRITGRWPPRLTAITASGLGKLTWWRKAGPRLYGAGHVS